MYKDLSTHWEALLHVAFYNNNNNNKTHLVLNPWWYGRGIRDKHNLWQHMDKWLLLEYH